MYLTFQPNTLNSMEELDCVTIYLMYVPFVEIHCIGVYRLCVIFITVHMEHVTPINQPLVLLIPFLQW